MEARQNPWNTQKYRLSIIIDFDKVTGENIQEHWTLENTQEHCPRIPAHPQQDTNSRQLWIRNNECTTQSDTLSRKIWHYW